jgi:hypothetical protein
MPARRRVSRRRLAIAALLVALAGLPWFVRVEGGMFTTSTKSGLLFLPTQDRQSYLVRVNFLDHVLFVLNTPSADRARGIGYRWEQYRQCWRVFTVAAAGVLIWPLLPIRAIFADDEEAA